ncbi:MAG: prepilin-type N-terminal cleavage/methylation domain-containing protein [Persicimonas sp.]
MRMLQHMRVMNRRRPKRGGFTLVELMVAVVLLSVVVTVIFALFSTTSDSMYEADSLADTVDRARFALERVSTDVRGAGSYGTPDAEHDKWVKPKPSQGNSLPMFGLVLYDGWQDGGDDRIPSDVRDAHGNDNNPPFSFDGIIVIGAFDFPQSFEVTDLTFDGNEVDQGVIPANERGLYKLMVNDPFYVSVGEPPGFDSASDMEHLTEYLPSRVIRVMDRDGYFQFGGVKPNVSDSPTGLTFTLEEPWMVRDNDGGKVGGGGLEPGSVDDDDIGYDAALLDAYWYYIEPDPRDPVNFRLVRERLNARELLNEVGSDGKLDDIDNPGEKFPAMSDDGSESRQRAVITDRVVDFQIWFDCADNAGNVEGVEWRDTWVQDDPGDCAEGSNVELGKARTAHLRLSLRTEHERGDNPDSPNAIFSDDEGDFDPHQPMRYFNMYPDAEGSARVVTVQNDVELTTFAMRNVNYRGGQ